MMFRNRYARQVRRARQAQAAMPGSAIFEFARQMGISYELARDAALIAQLDTPSLPCVREPVKRSRRIRRLLARFASSVPQPYDPPWGEN